MSQKGQTANDGINRSLAIKICRHKLKIIVLLFLQSITSVDNKQVWMGNYVMAIECIENGWSSCPELILRPSSWYSPLKRGYVFNLDRSNRVKKKKKVHVGWFTSKTCLSHGQVLFSCKRRQKNEGRREVVITRAKKHPATSQTKPLPRLLRPHLVLLPYEIL